MNSIKTMSREFRKVFTLPDNNVMRWFPGHMNKALNRIQSLLRNVDCVVEIHDARIPISGRNPKFSDLITLKPHVLLLNKADLCDHKYRRKIKGKLLNDFGIEHVMFTNCSLFKSQEIQRDLIPVVMKAIHSRPRYNRTDAPDFNIMVMGVPNTGKSTFINSVRRIQQPHKRNIARSVGALAGFTKGVKTPIKVSFNPEINLIDTPGILTPTIPNIEAGMRLSLCGCLPDHLVGEHYIVDYLLYWFNKHGYFSYVTLFGLNEPTENVMDFLSHVAKDNDFVKRVKDVNSPKHRHVYKPDYLRAAQLVLKTFRTGMLGHFVIDEDLLE